MQRLLRPAPGPSTLKLTRWGGTRLAALRDHPDPTARVGESWEFSTLPDHTSRVGDRPLTELLGGPLPFLAKLIDTALPLSVQVHPGDTANIPDRPDRPDRPGKEEAWVILAADPGATVWAGLADTCTPADFRSAVAAGAPLLALLRAIPVVTGSVVLVPARTVHAIGGGILLAEIQQPSDCTYRFHDHGSERPIQPREALAAVDLEQQPHVWQPGSPPATLRGRHLQLEILGPGAHRRDRPRAPTLVIPARGHLDLHAPGEHQQLAASDLALARSGPFWLELPPGSLAVLGHI
ncbi:MAG: class I mannose-6-phosphate isomerase [Nannocystis sp.]|uniref:class I mannose-6-phosphate isomerase n=1 Tax=Nannocystis sp. TaxID=1962667 RepID=UPI002425AA09|nr:class I mannose-6-phosphate isomerase [Nannocystis sp.]MBK9755419.1 class I mannose-6-phosphate isomerase [Nannocystis sp.]